MPAQARGSFLPNPAARGLVLCRVHDAGGEEAGAWRSDALQERLACFGVGGLWLTRREPPAGQGEALALPHTRHWVQLVCRGEASPHKFQGLKLDAVLVQAMSAGHAGKAAPGLQALSLINLLQLLDAACIAPALHAGLSLAAKMPASGWPCWSLGHEAGMDGADSTGPACSEPLLRQLAALQMTVRGSPVLDWEEVLRQPFPGHDVRAHLATLRRSHAALARGRMRLLPVHEQLLAFERYSASERILCAFNLSPRYVRWELPPSLSQASLMAGSGLSGARIVQGQLDFDPWGGLLAVVRSRPPAA